METRKTSLHLTIFTTLHRCAANAGTAFYFAKSRQDPGLTSRALAALNMMVAKNFAFSKSIWLQFQLTIASLLSQMPYLIQKVIASAEP
jgi:hypothetical protein